MDCEAWMEIVQDLIVVLSKREGDILEEDFQLLP
jgi:hypothetical protein